MFAITGITGQVGGVLARTLLADGKNVRAVARDETKARHWVEQGCEMALARMDSAEQLRRAFAGCEGVFILLPPNFDPDPGFSATRQIAAAVRQALEEARPRKVVCLSTIGAQATQSNLLTQLRILEQALASLPLPVTFLRPAWYMENAAWDIAPARAGGALQSFLQPLDKPVPMISVLDVGRIAAELLQEDWSGHRVVELEGPSRVSPNEMAAALGRLLGREVRIQEVPREAWETLFKSQGMKNPVPRMRMLDGFNQGWIAFESQPGSSRKGTVQLEASLKKLLERP